MYIDGIITRGIGGLYTVKEHADSKTEILCRPRGIFRLDGIAPTVGDSVTVQLPDINTNSSDLINNEDNNTNTSDYDFEDTNAVNAADDISVIIKIKERKSCLIRPPVANLDVIFVIIPTLKPAPMLTSADKLLCIAEHADINPAVIVTKRELDEEMAAGIAAIYEKCGFNVFTVSAAEGSGLEALKNYIASLGKDAITAFAGASGAGKSTLLNRLYPSLSLQTGALSRKISRGRQTTRHIELYSPSGDIYIADTPGFSLLDFERYDFFSCEALPFTFREFEPYIGKCRYTKCTHLKEEGCAVLEAVKNGTIPKERHESYIELYGILKNKHPWDAKHSRQR